MRTLWRNAHLTTLADASGWGFIRRGALVVDDELIRWVGSDADLPAG
jgi:imidazolonepropionase